MPSGKHGETHSIDRVAWLRAAVLGANDGIVSIASLISGVAASATAGSPTVFIAGLAGLVAGAMSMAAGEYVSVSSQADAEAADMAKERRELAEMPEAELRELTDIYVARGLTPDLAQQVAEQLTQRDALAAHAREELGISDYTAARPVVAALASAASFAVGAAVPLATAIYAPQSHVVPAVALSSLVCLAALGSIGARAGGAKPLPAALRVTFWGALAMALTAAIGAYAGTAV